MRFDGVINLDTLYDQPVSSEFFTDEYNEQAALLLPSSSTLVAIYPTVDPQLHRILFGIPEPCTYNQPALLPRPQWHVETVRVHPFARFAYMKQKARRLARERLNNRRP